MVGGETMSFADKKGIVVASGFKLQAETLLDVRQQVDTIQERDELVTIHAATPGLRVYVKNENTSYVYNGTSWDKLTTGDAYVHPTGDGYHHVPATGNNNNGKVLMAGTTAGSEHWQTLTTNDISDFPDSLPTPNNLVVKFNGGATEGTNQFTFNGSTSKTVNITPAAIGASTSNHTHTHTSITDFDEAVGDLLPTELPNPESLTISLNGTSQGGYDGSSAKNINITPASIGAAPTSHGTHVTYGTEAPKANGTASAGTASSVSRSDHVHPLQTTISGNAGSATKLATARTIDGVSFNGTTNINHFATCSTAAATAAKTVSLTGFTLAAGATITVKFSNTNTAANPTLNVNNTGAKSIMYRGTTITAEYLAANRVYTFVYDGTDYELIGDINTDTNTTYTTGTAITSALSGKANSSHTHTSASITDFDDAVDALLPTTLPNPQALTISLNGTSQGAYTGSAAKSINITPASIGASASGHTHTSANITDFDEAVGDLIPTIPTKLPNPYAITFAGAVTGSYDGSSATTITIPTTAAATSSSLVIKLNGGTTEGTNQFTFNGSTAKTINITPSSIGAATSGHTHGVATTSANGFLRALNGSTANFLRGDGTWATPPNATYSTMKGATADAAGATGLVPAPAAGKQTSYLRGDGTWVVPPNTNTTYTLSKSGSTITLTGSDGKTTSVTDANTTYSLSSFGITATAAELNKLDGVTATAAELNYVDGVTSNIQTQLNGKASSSHTHNYAGSSSAGGVATSAAKLSTARTISLSGDASGSVSFNGTANVSIPATVLHHGSTSIPNNANMNSYTNSGWYYCPANATVATLTNCPTTNAFSMVVTQHAGTNQFLIEYMTGSPRIFTRNLYNGSWGAWYEIYHTGQKPTASEIGAAASSHNHSAANITSGTLAIARGGTGITSNPSMLVNLGSTSAASVFAASPRPGITGTLSIAHGGTGATTAAAARSALGAAAASHTHNYAGSSSAGGAATVANKINLPVGTTLFATSSSATFFSATLGGTWTVVGNIDTIVVSSGTALTLYLHRKTAS